MLIGSIPRIIDQFKYPYPKERYRRAHTYTFVCVNDFNRKRYVTRICMCMSQICSYQMLKLIKISIHSTDYIYATYITIYNNLDKIFYVYK